jgi:HEAT repeat protein
LVKGLEDPLFLVRLASIQALSETAHPEIASGLRIRISDKAMVVRTAAVDAVARFKDRESVPILIDELMEKRNFHRGQGLWIRNHIVDALGEIGDESAAPTLVKVLKEENLEIRERACGALGRLFPAAPPAKEATLESCDAKWIAWFAESKKEKN